MGKVDLIRFDSPAALAQAAAREWLDQLPPAQPQRCAFSGGRIAEKFFVEVTAQTRERGLDLNHLHFFAADERCVPPDHADSNFRLMKLHLLDPLRISAAQVHRIRGEAEPVAAAREASDDFARHAAPALDFVFLGMGEDGHVASIFPGDDTDEVSTAYYHPVVAPKPPPHRITLVMHALVAARDAWVLASGPGKAEALGNSLRPDAVTPLGKLIARRAFTRVFTHIS